MLRTQRCFEPTSIQRFVIKTRPRICLHSETMFPTTCPHLLFGSIARNAAIQPMAVIARKMVSQCSRGISMTAETAISPSAASSRRSPFRTGASSLP